MFRTLQWTAQSTVLHYNGECAVRRGVYRRGDKVAIQQRAERTRLAILTAAARVFDAVGYERASLARISAEAQVTTGALVFHFATKADLAAAVRERARAVTGVTVETACLSGGTAVEKLVSATRALVRLLETDCVARAGERLARELQPAGSPMTLECPWRREVARLVRRAGDEGALHPGVDGTVVAALIGYVVQGVELAMRAPASPDGEPWPGEIGAFHGSAAERLERIWELILPGLVPPGPAGLPCRGVPSVRARETVRAPAS